MSEIWILGATGRSGRAIAAGLTGAGLSPVLVGRDTVRLHEVAAVLDRNLRIVTTGSIDAVVHELSQSRPAIVINTIGPFSETALPIARACLPSGAHYVDISNELSSVIALLGLHDEAASSGCTFVTGAGFGVLATESIVLKLCEGQPAAASVRVDAMAIVEPEAGRVGTALAATIVEILAAGGRRYERGRLVRSRLLSDLESLRLPDGFCVKTGTGPSGELEAARRASGASFAVSASSMVPASSILRAVLPAILPLLKITPLRNLAIRQVAGIAFKKRKQSEPGPKERQREFSWGHAQVQWASGAHGEGWLRTGDAHVFATNVAVEVARRLARDEGRPGAYTPGALFGPGLAIDAGGKLMIDHAPIPTGRPALGESGSGTRRTPIPRPLVALAAGFVLAASPAAASGLGASYAVDVAGITVLDFTASLDFNEGAYAVGTTARTRGVASVFIRGQQTSHVDGAWRGVQTAPTRYRADGVWNGTARHTELGYERGLPIVRVLDPPETELRFPVPPEQRNGTIDPLSAFARLMRQVRDTGRCDGQASIFEGRVRLEITVRTEGIQHLDGGRGGWSGDALRCAYESRVIAGFRRDQNPADAVRPERGTAWIAAPAPGMLPVPVRIDASNRWFGSTTVRLVHVEALPDG